MKATRTIKQILVAAMAAAMVLGTQVTAFAAVDSSSEASSESVAAQTEASTTAASNADESSAAAQPEGTTNDANPNTGVSVFPMAAALLAIGAVPVILKTRK